MFEQLKQRQAFEDRERERLSPQLLELQRTICQKLGELQVFLQRERRLAPKVPGDPVTGRRPYSFRGTDALLKNIESILGRASGVDDNTSVPEEARAANYHAIQETRRLIAEEQAEFQAANRPAEEIAQ